MRIFAKLDRNEVEKYVARGSPIFSSIYWEHDGSSYPDSAWSDFSITILGWWIRSCADLLRGSSRETFSFMDGPYSIKACRENNSNTLTLSLEGREERWFVSIDDIRYAIIDVCQSINRDISQMNIDSCYSHEIVKFISMISSIDIEYPRVRDDLQDV